MFFLRTAVNVLHKQDYRIGRGVLLQLTKQINARPCYSQKAKPGEEEPSSTSDEPNEKEQEKGRKYQESMQKQLMVRGAFEQIQNKNRETYLDMIRIFDNRTDSRRRNHVEFIYAALKNMEQFGVHKDLSVYKALIDVMPKGNLIPQNAIQVEFQHYPKQQQCIIDLLEQMEDNGVMPDYEMEDMLVNVFGKKGHPVRKFWRMMYWMPKFRNASPWALPHTMPDEILEIAKMAVERMCTVDLNSTVTVYETKDVEESLDDTWIVSGQSPDQKELLQKHNPESAVHIEGPFIIWLRDKSIQYFVLRGDPPTPAVEENEEDPDDVRDIKFKFFGLHAEAPKRQVALNKTVHEQDDGVIFAICATGSSSKDSLLSWIRLLEKDGNPSLGKIPVLFKFRTPPTAELVPT